jgi:hypothetical protein
VSFSPDGKLILAGLGQGENAVILLEAASGKEVKRWKLHGAFYWAGFAPDGRHVITGNANGTIYILRLADPPRRAAR